MTLEEKILDDFKDAMKQKDAVKISTLSFLRGQLGYAALEKKKEKLDDADCIAVVKKLIKQHQDSIEQFTAGSRLDLAERETKEMEVLKGYVPAQMPAEEISRVIEEVVAASGASGMKDMGNVMKEVRARTGGRADGKLVSDLVRQRLSRP
ncbi:MAG: GatB/YqeY domain-containing protein [Candidatus Omnitrophica bacterium]|nr:GatB/YqeY domain-containing protein [Candidatus Omnitrophota bacterium]MDD4940552.1 GatB/YqeY domain-containing protein [Candidatus Omnitrophota bacterium]MDD5774847.1 GatB/YqeY domain-containing protein [Candidatus Omnitrophota bacterium]HNQ50438.1 GatB/YqeY domain-containing protein [Candidatus Omnitrophota bacterium]HQO37418.1 GatB/YqeY domain-containing protein [Candidatus Omnitrophota bacterium]